ncbi:MAG: protein kinase [Muribaculaceae bacterium]|nr:protein kinase [Muribaculaceae bacterium]
MAKGSVGYTLPPGFKLKSNERTYEIVKVLGAGSFGITYLATSDISIGNISVTAKFAIKEHFISASCFRGDDGASVNMVPAAKDDVVSSRADFLTEANRLKKICLKSRSIVSVNETFETNGTAYYVMEFLDGGNPEKCSEEEAVSIVRDIAQALKYIHAENVLHLDIKPDNIVLKTNEKGETYPVLIDFGISKHFNGKGRPTSSLNAKGASVGYAPQEQYAGISEFSPKFDIYALGGVLFYLLTGKNPPDAFKVSGNQQELKKELDGNASEKVSKAILHAMKPGALERTPNVESFLDELSGIEFVPELKSKPTHLKFDRNKGKDIVSVVSNISWEAFSTQPWCKVKRAGDNLNISVSGNTRKGSSTRQCEVILKGTDRPVSFSIQITQQGNGTEVISKRSDSIWRIRNKKNVLFSVLGVAILAGIIIMCFFIGENTSKQAMDIAEVDSIDMEVVVPIEEPVLDNQSAESSSLEQKEEKNELQSQETFLTQQQTHQQEPQQSQQLHPQQPQQGHATSDVPKEPSLDDLYAQANSLNDFKYLANKGYSKAYAPLAELYLKENNYNEASQMALKAGQSKTGLEKARKVASILNTLGYYDDKPGERERIIKALGEI